MKEVVGVIGAAGEIVCKRLVQVKLRAGRGGSRWQLLEGRKVAVFGLGGKEGLVGRVRSWCPGVDALFLILKFLPVDS